MKLHRSDFSYSCNIYGYMLKFRGHNIGGAGTMPRDKPMHWRHRLSNLALYQEQAEMEIHQLVAGHGQPRFWSVIKEHLNGSTT